MVSNQTVSAGMNHGDNSYENLRTNTFRIRGYTFPILGRCMPVFGSEVDPVMKEDVVQGKRKERSLRVTEPACHKRQLCLTQHKARLI